MGKKKGRLGGLSFCGALDVRRGYAFLTTRRSLMRAFLPVRLRR